VDGLIAVNVAKTLNITLRGTAESTLPVTP